MANHSDMPEKRGQTSEIHKRRECLIHRNRRVITKKQKVKLNAAPAMQLSGEENQACPKGKPSVVVHIDWQLDRA